MPCPLNEFSEHCTGDMPSMDWAWHSWMQEKYDEQRKALERKAKQTNEEESR
jgi:hypothetical protein